jgi:VWFA-related protein
VKRTASVIFLFLLGSTAFAQLRESVSVEVVQVPVYVTAHGAAVSGLTRDNFRLFINGKAQSIDYFDRIDFNGLPAGETSDLRQRRLYLLVFDLTFSSANSLRRAQNAAEQMVEASTPGDTFGIATLTPSRGAAVVVPFSQDRPAVVNAVRNLRLTRLPDPLRLALTPAERAGIAGGRIVGGGGSLPADAEEAALRDSERSAERDMVEDEIGDLGDLAVRLAPLEGVKHVVLLSTGFDSSLIHGVQRRRDLSDIRQGPLDSFRRFSQTADRRNLPLSPALMEAIQRLNETFARSSVFLDAIDIGGLRPMQQIVDNESLYALTRGSGGEVVDRRNDLAGAMTLLTNLQRFVYVLSFNARNTGRDDNKIVVKLVDAPHGAHASYRTSYAAVVDPPDASDPLRLADIVVNDIPQTGVTTKTSVDTAPQKATVNIEVAGGELAAQANGMTLQGQALIYIFCGPGAVAFDRKEITIEPQAMTALASRSVRLSQTFDLPPGRYVAKALIRFGVSGSLGFSRADFTIPPTVSP